MDKRETFVLAKRLTDVDKWEYIGVATIEGNCEIGENRSQIFVSVDSLAGEADVKRALSEHFGQGPSYASTSKVGPGLYRVKIEEKS